MIKYTKVSEWKRGILVCLLKQAYSFNSQYEDKFLPTWQLNDDFFFDHLDIADLCCFITVLDGEPIGYIAWDPRHLPEYIEIGDNCIIPQYKGLGYGKLQLKEAIRRIKEKNVKKIIVTTDEDFIPAQHNYESVGFQKVRRWKEKETLHIDYEMQINESKGDKMLEIDYGHEISAMEYLKLRELVGWGTMPVDQAQCGLDGSKYIIVGREHGKAVSLARVIGDGGCEAIICDVIVHPNYQKSGIGKTMMQDVLNYLNDSLKPGWKIKASLFAALGKEEFYKKFNFHVRPNETHGCGMDTWITKEE